jgi:tRNA threonylcarbamoyladenosine biosynthesis protein TsaB
MRVLALDAATEACSVALLSNGEVMVRIVDSGKSSAQQILSLVEEVMAEGQVSLSMLDGIAASIGPGAFTGVRISVAVAQGLAFGADLPVAPVSTLEALALQVLYAAPGPALACLDARMGEVYWGRFTADAARAVIESGAPQVGAPAAVAVALRLRGPHIGIGRGFSAYPELAKIPGVEINSRDSLALPNAREFARLGAQRLAGGGGLDPADLKPLYLRDKVALTEAERAAHSQGPASRQVP